MVNSLKTLLFLPEDEIIRQGDFGNRIYFIGNGSVDVFLVTEKYKKKHKGPALEEEKEPSVKRHTERKPNVGDTREELLDVSEVAAKQISSA